MLGEESEWFLLTGGSPDEAGFFLAVLFTSLGGSGVVRAGDNLERDVGDKTLTLGTVDRSSLVVNLLLLLFLVNLTLI